MQVIMISWHRLLTLHIDKYTASILSNCINHVLYIYQSALIIFLLFLLISY